jgi:hypothetical protein
MIIQDAKRYASASGPTSGSTNIRVPNATWTTPVSTSAHQWPTPVIEKPATIDATTEMTK